MKKVIKKNQRKCSKPANFKDLLLFVFSPVKQQFMKDLILSADK
jgi:hypothetical protein